MLTRRYQLLLLSAVILAAFYPAVLTGFSRIDDAQMAESYGQIQSLSLRAQFIPAVGGGYYYRPLIGTSFTIDKYLFDFSPGMMHLENILMHLINAVLVYFLTLNLLAPDDQKRSYLPLLAALLFGLHPINTESVNWISGRTDIFAASFVLLGTLFILKYSKTHVRRYLALSLVAFLGGALTKETALAFLPGAFLMVSAVDRHGNQYEPALRSENSGFVTAIKLLSGSVAVVLTVYLLRKMAFTSTTSQFSKTLIYISTDWLNSMSVCLRAFGFYMKELIIPYPLNFAIDEVDPLYEILSVPVVALCIYIASSRSLLSAVFITGVSFIAPAFLLAFGQIAWTPYAERYVYITSTFFVVATTVFIRDAGIFRRVSFMYFTLSVIAAFMFIATLNRSIVWHDDLALCKDTVEKSPLALSMRVTYSTLLAEKGDYDEALRQVAAGRAIPHIGYDERIDVNTAFIYYKQGKIDEAIKTSEIILRTTDGTSTKALGYLIAFTEMKEQRTSDYREKQLLNQKLCAYNLQLYKLTHDPYLLYRLGVTSEALGDKISARAYFQQACDNMKDGDLYKLYAKKRLRNLKKAHFHAEYDNT